MLIESTLLDNPRSVGRLRFTIAHELSHNILHKPIFKGTKAMAAYQKSDKRNKDRIEFQANYLASAFLMPAPSLKLAYNQSRFEKCDVVAKLAKMFEVSKEAMRIRLKELGLT
jgi:Zn-dependent peptidase ImmA (M78 family)